MVISKVYIIKGFEHAGRFCLARHTVYLLREGVSPAVSTLRICMLEFHMGAAFLKAGPGCAGNDVLQALYV